MRKKKYSNFTLSRNKNIYIHINVYTHIRVYSYVCHVKLATRRKQKLAQVSREEKTKSKEVTAH